MHIEQVQGLHGVKDFEKKDQVHQGSNQPPAKRWSCDAAHPGLDALGGMQVSIKLVAQFGHQRTAQGVGIPWVIALLEGSTLIGKWWCGVEDIFEQKAQIQVLDTGVAPTCIHHGVGGHLVEDCGLNVFIGVTRDIAQTHRVKL